MRCLFALVVVISACGNKGGGSAPAPAGGGGVAVAPNPVPTNGAALAIGAPRFALGTRPKNLAFSPDGKQLAACGDGAELAVWEVATGKRLAAAKPFYACTALAWMPDGARLAVAGIASFDAIGAPVALVDAATGKILATSSIESRDNIQRAVPTADGKIALAADDGYTLWDGKTSKRLETIDWKMKETRDSVVHGDDVAYVEDGKHLVVRKVAPGAKPTCKLDLSDSPSDMTWSADGKSLGFGRYEAVELVDVAACKSTVHAMKGVKAVAFGADGVLRAITSTDDEALGVGKWPFDGKPVVVPGHGSEVPYLALSPDARYLAVDGALGVHVYDLAAKDPTAQPPGHVDEVRRIAMWADGTVVTASRDAVIAWRDGGKLAAVAPTSLGDRGAFALDARGHRLVFDLFDGKDAIVSIVDLDTNAVTRRIKRDTDSPAFAWDLDGKLIAGGREKARVLPDTDDGKELGVEDMWDVAELATNRDGTLLAGMSWNADSSPKVIAYRKRHDIGRLPLETHDAFPQALAVGNQRVAVVTATSPREATPTYGVSVFTLEPLAEVPIDDSVTARKSEPCAAAFGAGDRMAIGFVDGGIVLLDKGGKVARTLESKAGQVSALAFSEDDKHLVSAHADGQVFVWAIE